MPPLKADGWWIKEGAGEELLRACAPDESEGEDDQHGRTLASLGRIRAAAAAAAADPIHNILFAALADIADDEDTNEQPPLVQEELTALGRPATRRRPSLEWGENSQDPEMMSPVFYDISDG